MKKILGLCAFLFFGQAVADDISTKTMMIRGVDKVTGHVSTVKAVVHEPLEFGSLTIMPEKCLTRPPEETPENAAFFRIFEKDSDGVQKTVFNGWMFSSNPALSAMEHARYDIWVLYCVNEDIRANIVSPDKIAPDFDLNLVAEDDNPALSETTED